MNQIQELCARLTERGVEYTIAGYGSGYVKWQANRTEFMAFAHDGDLSVCQLGSVTLSPEEAIRATLGPGTCEPVEQYLDLHSDLTVMVCSNCGVPADDLEDSYYCSNCGAKVVDE